MKNVNIMGVHQFLREGITKINIYGELPKKEASQKIGAGCFWGVVDTSMHSMT